MHWDLFKVRNMADEISEATLKEEIESFLKDADLAKTSTKKVRQALEKKLDVSLRTRSKEIDKIVMDYINSMESPDEKSDNEKEKSENDSDSDSDEKPRKTRRAAAPKATKATKTTKRASGGGVTKGKGTGFTRPYKLSPQLAELMGADVMPRHAVVKRIWAIVKEKQLYDPNNKQFAICDDAMFKVIGKQRFRIFGMMKYLKSHFKQDE